MGIRTFNMRNCGPIAAKGAGKPGKRENDSPRRVDMDGEEWIPGILGGRPTCAAFAREKAYAAHFRLRAS